MLEILLSPGQRELQEAILERICGNETEGQLLLVPEQASHELERALCAAGGDGICLRAEVLSFSRLASRVFSLYGGVSRPSLDKGGRLIAMAQALEAVSSQLKLYAASRRRSEFLLRMLRMIEELRAARITAEALHKTAGQTEGQLAVKLAELALILESYETVCATMGQDPNHRLALLAGQLEEHPEYAAGRDIYLLGFTDLTGQELAVLDALLEGAASLTAGLLGDGSGGFPLTDSTVKALGRLAKGHGLPSKTAILPDGPLPPELLHLRRRLFTGAPNPFPGDAPAVRLHHSTGFHGACLDAAGLIQALTLERGWRYRDVVICCASPETYGPVLESVFGRLQIPLYRAGTEPIRSDPVAGMLLAALEAAGGGMELEEVLRFLKCGLSPLRQTESDELELYARTWRVRGKRWGEVWDMPPGGLRAKPDERDRETLARLNGYRIVGVGPLLALRDGLRDAKDTAGQVCALYAFLETVGLRETLEDLVRRCEDEAQLQRAQAYGQMYETVVEALEQLYRVLGPTVRTGEDFSGIVAAVLSQYTVGTIPANLDSVVVGGPEAMRFTPCRALLVLGAEDGTLPSGQSETGLLTERERRKLMELGLPVAPGQSDKLDRELIAIHQVVTAPAELLSVNYCGEQPAYLVRRLRALFPNVETGEDETVPAALTYAAGPLAEFLAGRTEELPSSLAGRAEALRTRADYRPGRLGTAGVRALYGPKIRLSATKIDQYAACRCAYFLRYGLKLDPRREASFDAPAYGTFVHAVLERTARRVKEAGGFHVVSPERLDQIAEEEMDAYPDEALEAMLARSARFAYLFRRSRREVMEVVRELGAELRASDFEPECFELEFSSAGELPEVQIEGKTGRAVLQGFVDRVDFYTKDGETYVRVADYKTGKKSFDYTDIANGMGLQMLIYLFTLAEKGEKVFGRKLRPAGVLYVPARRPILPAAVKPGEELEARRRDEQRRKGLLLADGEVLEAMEHCGGSPVYLPFGLNKEGALTGDLATREDFSLLQRHVERTLAAMADGLAGGEVSPNPIVRGSEYSACAWCDFAQVCHRASGEVPERPMQKTGREQFWTRLREEDTDG